MARENVELRLRVTGEDAGAKRVLDELGDEAGETQNDLDGMGAAGMMALEQINQAAEQAWAALMKFGRDVVAMTREMSASYDEVAKKSRAIGIDPNQFAALGFALEREGGNAESMSRALEILSQRMGDVQSGSAEAVRDFQALGIAVQNADGTLRPVGDVLLDIADKMALMDDKTKRMDLARGMFGRAGGQFVNLLSKGREGISQLTDEYERLHGHLTTKQFAAMEEYQDALTDLNIAMMGLKAEAILPMVEALKPIVQQISDIVVGFREFADQHPGLVKVGTAVGGVGFAVATLVVGLGLAAIKVVTMIASMRVAMAQLGIQTDIVTAKMGRLGTVSQGVAGKAGGMGMAGGIGMGVGATVIGSMQATRVLNEDLPWYRRAFGLVDAPMMAYEQYKRGGRKEGAERPLQIEGSVELKGATTANVSADVTGLM